MDNSALWAELDELLNAGHTGKIILHANEGRVLKFVIEQTRRPRGDDSDDGMLRKELKVS